MLQKTSLFLCLLSLLFLSSCQQFTAKSHQEIKQTQVVIKSCAVSTDTVLSCIASSKQLSADALNVEFDSIADSLESVPDNSKLNRLICLSLHRHSSMEHLEKSKALLEKKLTREKCAQQNLTGLLLIIQGNIDLHKKYRNKNLKLHLEKEKISSTKETIKQEFDHEVISYQRRIQDLEQQVQKLKEIESMLDKNAKP